MANKGRDLQPDETLVVWWEYPKVFTSINRLLKPHGIVLKARANYSRFGDLVAVRVDRAKGGTSGMQRLPGAFGPASWDAFQLWLKEKGKKT